VGGRVAWHHIAATALGVGLPATDLAALAEALFVLVDELCAASTDGYVAAQTASAAEREHRRDVLVDMLLSDRSDMAALQAAAAEAGWALPKRAAVIFVEHGNDAGRQALGRLGPHCLPVRNNGLPGAILPDADGPGLRRSGALTADPLFVDEHLDALIVHRDPRLLTILCEQCLAPLANAAPGSRQILLDTLRCWLRNMGDQQSVAATLHVHRQNRPIPDDPTAGALRLSTGRPRHAGADDAGSRVGTAHHGARPVERHRPHRRTEGPSFSGPLGARWEPATGAPYPQPRPWLLYSCNKIGPSESPAMT